MAQDDPLPIHRFEDYVRYHAREHELAGHVMEEAKEVVNAKLFHLNNLRQDFASKDDLKGLTEKVNSLMEGRAGAVAAARVWGIVAGTVVSVVLQLVFQLIK